MTRPGPWIVFSFWVLLAQIFLLSQIEVGGYLSPYLYPLILVLAPANFNRLGLVAISAVIGLGIDLLVSAALSTAVAWFIPKSQVG